MNFVLLDLILTESVRQLALEQRSREIIAGIFADAQKQLIREGNRSTFYVCNYLLSETREEHIFHSRRANVVFRALFNPFPDKDIFLGAFWSTASYDHRIADYPASYERNNIMFNTGRLMALQVAEDLVRSGQVDDLIFEATL